MHTNATRPRIYVACLASYNDGILYGRWIDADQDADAIREEIAAMIARSPTPGAEEWAIHDREGLGDVGEFADLDRVAEIGQAVAAAGDNAAALLAWLNVDPRYRRPEDFEAAFRGQWDSAADYAEDFWTDAGGFTPDDSPCHPSQYVDWERVARDLELSGDIETIDCPGGVWVFTVN